MMALLLSRTDARTCTTSLQGERTRLSMCTSSDSVAAARRSMLLRAQTSRRAILGRSAGLAALSWPRAVPAADPSVIIEQCRDEIGINGGYLQPCMTDSQRAFEWPAPVGRVMIEQGPLGPSATGEVVWNSAPLLADYEARVLGTSFFKGKRVLELGCGTALPSIVASKLGAASVLATDGSVEVCRRAERNVALNCAAAATAARRGAGRGGAIGCQQLFWTANGMLEGDGLEQSFDVVLAADVLWILSGQNQLAATVKAALAPNGVFLLAETGHDGLALPQQLSNFRAIAEGAGLRWEGTETLPLQVDGYDAQVVEMRVRS